MAPALQGLLGGGSIDYYSVHSGGGGSWANVTFEVVGVIFDLGFPTAMDFQVAVRSGIAAALRNGTLDSRVGANCACSVEFAQVTTSMYRRVKISSLSNL